ncbi:MAG: putative lipid II flippase FtsW [Verrucomicrobia bacterium]|nr:putative lipid II flippase FtsW [Verrucomicrobiota bacterium]
MNRYAIALLISVVLLFALGLTMIFNTTSAEVLDRFLDRSTHHALIKQLLYAVVGGVGAVGVWFIGYQNLIKLSGSVLIGATVLLILVFLPGIGQQINGAHRWINVFGNSFQPSEFVKFLIPLYFIHIISDRKDPLELRPFLELLAKVSVPIGLILIEPDNGTVAIIFSALIILFLLTRQKWVYWALPLCVLLACGTIVASQMHHVSDRIKVYMNPEYDLKGKGHQPYQAKIAAGSGKLFGKGLGESLQKLEYLPEARSDYIAAIFAEETGFVGMTGLILLYMGIGFCGFSIAQRARDNDGFYIATIFTFLICFQAFLNLGVVSGLLPSKGTNLPFFSQGGSSLLANMMALCVLLNIAKQSEREHVKTT